MPDCIEDSSLARNITQMSGNTGWDTHKSACIQGRRRLSLHLKRCQVEITRSSCILTCSRKSFKVFKAFEERSSVFSCSTWTGAALPLTGAPFIYVNISAESRMPGMKPKLTVAEAEVEREKKERRLFTNFEGIVLERGAKVVYKDPCGLFVVAGPFPDDYSH